MPVSRYRSAFRVHTAHVAHVASAQAHRFSDGLKDIDESLKARPTYFKALLCRARIMVGLKLFETAAEDFRAVLEHGRGSMSAAGVRDVEGELRDAERLAEEERGKEQDFYAVLGAYPPIRSASRWNWSR